MESVLSSKLPPASFNRQFIECVGGRQLSLVQQAKDSNAVRRPHIYLSIGNHGWNKFIIGKMVAVIRRLVTVVQLGRQVRRVVGVQSPRAPLIFDGPHDPILRSVRAYAGGGSGVGKTSGRLAGRSRR